MAGLSRRVTRRSFLISTAGVSATSILAACGQTAPAPAPKEAAPSKPAEQAKPAAATSAPAKAAEAKPAAPGQTGVSKQFAGTTLNVASWSGPWRSGSASTSRSSSSRPG